jgi:hypothetical protein
MQARKIFVIKRKDCQKDKKKYVNTINHVNGGKV